MSATRMIKALNKHIANGKSMDTMIKWWNRMTCGALAHVDGNEVVFPLKTMTGKDYTQRMPVW